MVFLTTGMPILMGIFIALETLASQAFTGSGIKHQVGLFSQRAAILSMMSILPTICICLNSHWLLLALGQDPELAHMASIYLYYYILVIPAFVLNEIAKKFLTVQGKGEGYALTSRDGTAAVLYLACLGACPYRYRPPGCPPRVL